MSTDTEWEKWGQTDPYYGVFAQARFSKLKPRSSEWELLFAAGEHDIALALDRVRSLIDASFAPARALDFGCGVGRVAIPLARHVAQVVGADVSTSMLDEARLNAVRLGVSNVEFVLTDDALSGISGRFDFIHSLIVFQHIPVARGLEVFRRLLELLQPGGVASLHFTYARQRHAGTFGAPSWSKRLRASLFQSLRYVRSRFLRAAPVMEMNLYPLNHLFYVAQTAGIQTLHVELMEQGDVCGMHLVCRKPTPPSS